MRVGIGYDVHRLVEGRPLILGGVKVPFERGLLGHSDADVLVHAIIDSLLGAMGERDIGYHFPDSDDKYKNISSIFLLKKIRSIMEAKKYRLVNLDAVVIAQRPKLSLYIPVMLDNIAASLDVNKSRINLKATTTEGLDSFGKGEGIAAQAVVLLRGYEADCL